MFTYIVISYVVMFYVFACVIFQGSDFDLTFACFISWLISPITFPFFIIEVLRN